MTYLKCSYITQDGKPSKETFQILSNCVDIINTEVVQETKVKVNDIVNLLPIGLIVYIHYLERNE